MRCPTCDHNIGASQPMQLITIIGNVCMTCYTKLTTPTILTGCVTGPSIADLGYAMAREFEQRRTKLREQAKEVCR